MTHHTDAARALSNLRHLYSQMTGGLVKDSAQAKRIAEGLLSPAIVKLEQAARRAPASQGMDASTSIGTLWVEENGANDLELCPCAAPKLPPGEYALFARTKQGGA